MLTLANNHCMDRGETGIINTLENCERYGFDTIGIYNRIFEGGCGIKQPPL